MESTAQTSTERLFVAYKSQQLQKKEPQLQQQQAIATAQVQQQPHEIKPAIVQAQPQVQIQQPAGK